MFSGANVSDHEILFQLIIKQIVSTMDCHVISLQVTEDTSIKRLVENMVFGFMNFDNREVTLSWLINVIFGSVF